MTGRLHTGYLNLHIYILRSSESRGNELWALDFKTAEWHTRVCFIEEIYQGSFPDIRKFQGTTRSTYKVGEPIDCHMTSSRYDDF